MKLDDMTLDVNQHIEIRAAIGDVFRSVLYRLGEGNTTPKGESLQMILEQWPGGRWFRDRGNGIGHLWGHVQVIKPPVLLELNRGGPRCGAGRLLQVQRRHGQRSALLLHFLRSRR